MSQIENVTDSIHGIETRTLAGEPLRLDRWAGHVLLIVNVASKCGFTPQYEGLQRLHERYAGRGFSVLGFPCNQFGWQEPGSAERIQRFCSDRYGVTFPLFEKIKVRGRDRHPLYSVLSRTPDDRGRAGDVRWNFEKFLVGRDGVPARRWGSRRGPEDPTVTGAIEDLLGS